MIVSEIKLYELLRNSIGEKEAESFVYLTNENMEKKFEQWKTELATKDDLSALRTELLRTIYLTSMGQLIAIIASVVSLVMILKK
jgi:hypothetical protein